MKNPWISCGDSSPNGYQLVEVLLSDLTVVTASLRQVNVFWHWFDNSTKKNITRKVVCWRSMEVVKPSYRWEFRKKQDRWEFRKKQDRWDLLMGTVCLGHVIENSGGTYFGSYHGLTMFTSDFNTVQEAMRALEKALELEEAEEWSDETH